MLLWQLSWANGCLLHHHPNMGNWGCGPSCQSLAKTCGDQTMHLIRAKTLECHTLCQCCQSLAKTCGDQTKRLTRAKTLECHNLCQCCQSFAKTCGDQTKHLIRAKTLEYHNLCQWDAWTCLKVQLLVACRWLTSIAEVFEKVSTSDLWAGEWLEGINNQLAFLVPVPWRCPIHMCYPQETSGPAPPRLLGGVVHVANH